MLGAVHPLAAVVGADHVLTDADLTASYAIDWTGRFRGRAAAVVRPGTVEEVAAVLAWCDANGVAVVPQGGNTGLVGGSVPLAGEVVLSLRRLDAVGAVDTLAAQVTARAGATCAAVQRRAASAGLAFGVDLAARDSATIGGMVATNAGGLHVMRHGSLRAQVMGIEAVRADGAVLSHLGGLAKDNTGYDLAGLLCGSEGTLAVVTAVRLRLVPRHERRVVAALAVADAASAVAVCAGLRASLDTLSAAELMVAPGMELVCRHLGVAPPVAGHGGAWLLVECAGHDDPAPALAAALDHCRGGVEGAAVADDPAGMARLWRYREAHTEAIATLGVPHKLDVALPAAVLAGFCDDVVAAVAAHWPAARTVLFGHVGDGNIHVNVVGPDPDDEAVDDVVLGLAASMRGSISAEHGVGTAKKRWLHLNRSPVELATFRAIKAAFDPRGILNPNVLASWWPPNATLR